MNEIIFEQIEELTKEMVSIPSINGTKGETEIGKFIASYIRETPYFKENPEHLIVQELEGDLLKRKNVFALIKGCESNDTIMFHGHTDTVGIQDYKELSVLAFSPDKLAESLKETEIPEDVRKDLESGDYLFGRGACDMKSGDAVFLVLLKEYAKNHKSIKGNLLFSFNPVEENSHTGIIQGLKILKELKEKENLNYIMAINNDYICPLYPGDSKRYIYTGAVGKILPCFYIQGKETHVGQCFEGVDATMIASHLISRINENPEYCDGYKEEYTLPPSVLKMRDGKQWYNVQTAKNAFLYFNYFIHNASTEDIMTGLKNTTEEVLEELEKTLDQRYKKYCKISKIPYTPWKMEKQVYSYEELYGIAKSEIQKEELEEIVKREKEKGTDDREISVQITSYLLQKAKITYPCVVIFFAPPYCPHNTMGSSKKEEKLKEELAAISIIVGKRYKEEYKILNFFPSLSDSSYLKLDDSEESVNCLIKNFPQQEQIYPLPFKEMKALNIPAVNFGCYGKDAHKWTERVYKPYSFGVLPELIKETISYYLS